MRLPLLLLALAVPAAEPAKGKPTNRLGKESSPYLLQHAHNPVDWYPWGEEAFAKAKKEGKLVFLSIGYSSCHWCHVMEKESFSNEAIAKILNEHFVCIKVDREERPDVDNVYMTALNVLGQRGGWPLSMFLTAEGKPIVGGTYWPPEDKEIDGTKIRGFKTLLKTIKDIYDEKPDELKKQADRLADATSEALVGVARGIPLLELTRELVTNAVEGITENFDPKYGGFGSPNRQFRGTKFPTPPYLVLLGNEAARKKDKELAAKVELTLDKMALGGIYDHLGGGFHRYSTERTWTVPHFEKMLYDNAQLLELYAAAFKATKKPLYGKVLRETWGFVARELTDKAGGGFYSALDADSEGEEGRFYVWTPKDLKDALTDEERKLFLQLYGNDGKLNFDEKYHILTLAKPIEDKDTEAKAAAIREKLFAARAKRERPFLDTKVLTGWNGQMIAGAALAGQALDDKKPVEAAAKAADFILTNLKTKEGRLLRVWAAAPGEKPRARVEGYLDDYAYLVHGLLTLHDVTGEKRWLDEARALTDTMAKHHADEKVGGFFYTGHDQEKLFARSKDQYDGAQPAANSQAAKNLVRLWARTGDEKYKKLAEKSFKALAVPLKTNPTSLTALADALALYLDHKEKK